MKLFQDLFLAVIVAVVSAQSSRAMEPEERRSSTFEYWTAEMMDSASEATPLFDETTEKLLVPKNVGNQLVRYVAVGDAPSGRRQLDSRELQTMLEPADGSTFDKPRVVTFKTSLTAEQVAGNNVDFVYSSPSGVETVVPVLPGNEIVGTTVTEMIGGFTDGTWSWYVKGTDSGGAAFSTASSPNTFTITGVNARRLQTAGPLVGIDDWTLGGKLQTAVGKLFFVYEGAPYVCSGTTINDSKTGRSLILTAAHCILPFDSTSTFVNQLLFVPDRDSNPNGATTGRSCADDPCGCWTPSGGFILQEFFDASGFNRITSDYAILVVDDDATAHTGTQCNPTTTALDMSIDTMTFLAGPNEVSVVGQYIYALGYSETSSPGGSQLKYCADTAKTRNPGQYGETWFLEGCLLQGGSSGGPIVQNLSSGPGEVVSVSSWQYSNGVSLGASIVDQDRAECLVNMARNYDIATLETQQAVVVDSCTPNPTGGDVELTSAFAASSTASTSGDPHFKTWTGDKFDYHGECDLVLIDNPRFNKGQGLKLHIRTTRVGYYSYIERIAVQIGDDVLEFANDIEKSRLNGQPLPEQRKKHRDYFAGFYLRRDKKALSLRLDNQKKGGPRIEFIRRKNGFPAVVVDGGNNSTVFDGSMGMLGEHGTGLKLGRDGITNYGGDKDATDFALEWQVRDTEPMLFSEARYPQFPAKCVPPQKMMISRLGMARARQAAELACAHWKEDKEDCIFDAIATRDMTVAAEGSITSRSAVVA